MTTPPQPSSDPITVVPRRRGPSRSLVLVLISVATALWSAASLAVGVMAMFIVFLFDAPGSTEQLGTVSLAVGVVAFPPTCWLAILLSWVMFALRWSLASLACTALPLVPAAVATFGWIWIEVAQKGVLGG